MRKIVLRILAGLLGVAFGFTAYGYYTEPVGSDGRILGIIGMASCCLVALHYTVTGSRKLFFPKLGPLFPKKKRK